MRTRLDEIAEEELGTLRADPAYAILVLGFGKCIAERAFRLGSEQEIARCMGDLASHRGPQVQPAPAKNVYARSDNRGGFLPIDDERKGERRIRGEQNIVQGFTVAGGISISMRLYSRYLDSSGPYYYDRRSGKDRRSAK